MMTEESLEFACPGCTARYALPMDKVRGKIIKIRCKHCAALIELTERGLASGDPSPARAPRVSLAPPPLRGIPEVDVSPEPLSFAPAVSDAKIEDGHAVDVPFDFQFDSHYDVLGVSPRATAKQVESATFAIRKHYDRDARQGKEGASERMVQITTAGEVLSKPDKRAEYDRRAETVYLTTQDPVEEEHVDWGGGLELIRSLTLAPGDRDPVRELAELGAEERPNALLDELLK